MTKIKCLLTKKVFEADLRFRTLIRCPYCKLIARFSQGFIGLGFDTGIESEDPWHEIIYKNIMK